MELLSTCKWPFVHENWNRPFVHENWNRNIPSFGSVAKTWDFLCKTNSVKRWTPVRFSTCAISWVGPALPTCLDKKPLNVLSIEGWLWKGFLFYCFDRQDLLAIKYSHKLLLDFLHLNCCLTGHDCPSFSGHWHYPSYSSHWQPKYCLDFSCLFFLCLISLFYHSHIN